jgi:redox-sensitive bicupin YhaK (pirin superfamily)
MKTTIHRADSRGVAEHGWLHSRHTFSFASYYNPERMGFGKLRVINDDIVDGGAGFGTHPHDNMEIISIPLAGGLRHKDSMGNEHIINAGDVQIMSAGTGLTHSEYNGSDTETVNFLQIWVYPKFRNIKPRYDQVTLDPQQQKNQFAVVVSPDEQEGAVKINQDAWFSMGEFDNGTKAQYEAKVAGNGIYLFAIDGEISVNAETLHKRDAIAITDSDSVEFETNKPSKLLVIEVPLNN